MGTTYTARQTAALVNAALDHAGIKSRVDAKRVRAYVRDTIAEYDDDAYTAHAYTLALRDRIVAGMVARRTASGAKGTGTPARATSASKGRPPKGRKSPAKVNAPQVAAEAPKGA